MQIFKLPTHSSALEDKLELIIIHLPTSKQYVENTQRSHHVALAAVCAQRKGRLAAVEDLVREGHLLLINKGG